MLGLKKIILSNPLLGKVYKKIYIFLFPNGVIWDGTYKTIKYLFIKNYRVFKCESGGGATCTLESCILFVHMKVARMGVCVVGGGQYSLYGGGSTLFLGLVTGLYLPLKEMYDN